MSCFHLLCGVVFILVFCTAIRGQSGNASVRDIASYLQQNQIEVRLENGRLNEAAAKWLRSAAAPAQFVFIGEEHDTREIPQISAAVWRELTPLGYRHAAIEAGQWLGGRLDRLARFGDQTALAQFMAAVLPRRHNISVPPSSLEDLAFYAALGRGTQFRQPLIWGLDHEFKAAPLLTRLLALAGRSHRARINTLLHQIAAAEAAAQYNLQPFKPQIERLIQTIPARAGTEAAQILDALRRRICGASKDQERGDVMKQLFLQNYRAAQRAGEPRPRVMLRFGAYHAKRGLMSEFGSSTLANFVAELAFAENTQMLNLIFINCALDSTGDWRAPKTYPRPCSPRECVWLAPFAAAAQFDGTLFDVRPLRNELGSESLIIPPELSEIIAGFDAVVVLKNSPPASFRYSRKQTIQPAQPTIH